MQQIYSRTPMLKCNFIEITLRHGCSSVNLLAIFRTPFSRNTSEWLLVIATISLFLVHLEWLKQIVYTMRSSVGHMVMVEFKNLINEKRVTVKTITKKIKK